MVRRGYAGDPRPDDAHVRILGEIALASLGRQWVRIGRVQPERSRRIRCWEVGGPRLGEILEDLVLDGVLVQRNGEHHLA